MSIPQQTAERAPGSASQIERVPPQDLDAEQSVLGAMLLSKDAIGDAIDVLGEGGDFYRPAHETIYRAITHLYAKGEPADPITVTAELTKRGDVARVGGPSYVSDLANRVHATASAEYYAHIIRERAVFRRLAETGARISQKGFAGEGEAAEVVDQAQADLMEVISHKRSDETLSIGDTAEALMDRLEQRSRLKNGMRGLSTGFADLDSLTKGLLGGQFVIIAARPAVGKSTLAVDFVRDCAVKNGTPAALFSLEMGREEIEERVLSAQARVPHHHMASGQLSDDDWTRIARQMPEISAAPLYIDDTPNLSCMELAAKARRLKQKHDIKLIVVDYIQLMKSGLKSENRQQEVSDISRNLKLLAKSLDVPVIGLSQLNRGPEQRTDKKPVLSDLRESGSLEQDADIVILLHREDVYEKESPRAGEADLIVAKHRGGATATITVAAQLHYSRFVDMAQT